MREINLNRQKLGLEDLLFGVGIVTQIRAGQNVNVTRINAGNLPFDETQSLLEWAKSINLDALGSITTELKAIYANLTAIGNVEDNLTVINTLEDNLVALNSLYTNISKLQNIDTNMSKLQNIDTNMSKLQNIDTNMSKLQAIYTDLTKLKSIYDNLTMLLAIYNNLTALNNINSQVIPNLTELLLVNDNAIQVAADKLTVATDKGIVSGYKDAVSAMKVAVESIYDTFDDRFLGAKINDPILDNDGNALQDGAMYFNDSSNALKVYSLDNTTWYTIPQIYLSGLLDVTLTSITTGDILTWNGTKWVNTTIDSKLDLHGRTAKTTLVDTDEIMIADSASTWSLKKITWANIKTTLTSLFVAKVISTDNAIVRFNGTTGEVQNSSVIIDDNGNVGINNNNPLNKLHVGGSIIASDATQTGITAFIGAILNNNSTTPSLDIRRWNGSGTSHGVVKIAGNADGAMLFFVDTKSTNVEATTERMRIDGLGNLLIGTSVTNGLDKVQIEGTFSSKAVKAFTGIDLNTLKTRTEVCSVTNSCTNLPIAEIGILEVFMFDSNSGWVLQRFTAIGYPNAINQGRTFVRNWMMNTTWSDWVEK